MKTKDPVEGFQERNIEIGQILTSARQSKKRTISECAQHISTSRRRYTAIEKGEATISLPELEVIMQFLEVPISLILGDPHTSIEHRQLTLQAQSGETVKLIVEFHTESK